MLLFKLFLCSLLAIGLAEPLSGFFNIKDALQRVNGLIDDTENDFVHNYHGTKVGIENMQEDVDELSEKLSNKFSSSIKSIGNFADSLMGKAKEGVQAVKNTADKADVDELSEKLNNKLSSPIKSIGNFAGSLMGRAKQGVQAVKNTADKATKYTTDMLKSITGSAVNNGAKLFISQLTRFLRAVNLDVVKLPPISNKTPVMGGWAEIVFEAQGGHFGKLSSLQQKGLITFEVSRTSLVIDIPLTVTNLSVGYDEYMLSGFKLSTNGYFGIDVKSNAVNIRLRLNLDYKCVLNVEQIEITEMEGIDIKFEGLCNGCGTLVGYVSSQVANIVRDTIKVKLQETLDQELKNYVDAYPGLCAGFLNK